MYNYNEHNMPNSQLATFGMLVNVFSQVKAKGLEIYLPQLCNSCVNRVSVTITAQIKVFRLCH